MNVAFPGGEVLCLFPKIKWVWTKQSVSLVGPHGDPRVEAWTVTGIAKQACPAVFTSWP